MEPLNITEPEPPTITPTNSPTNNKKLNTLYKIFLYKDGVKTNKYYYYLNKAVATFNLYKAKKCKKLLKYCNENGYTIVDIQTIATLNNNFKKEYLKQVLNEPECVNNLFKRKKEKKENLNIPEINDLEQLKKLCF